MSDLVLRPAEQNELCAIVAIAQAAGVYQPSERDLDQTDVVSRAGKILAFATWQAVCDEGTLLGIAVDDSHRGQGIGKSLLTYGEVRLGRLGIERLFLEVRASNEAAQQLYRQCHYQIIAERKNYYPTADGREAAVVMSKWL